MRAALASAALLVVGLAGCGDDGATDSPTGDRGGPNATLEWVIDGDTIDVVMDDGREERVRLTGIDTPEIARDATDDRPARPGECFADQARDFVVALLPIGTPLRLERDIVGRDDFGRLLAYVYRSADDAAWSWAPVSRTCSRPSKSASSW